MTNKERYKLCNGRFGVYYHDRKENKDLDLNDVLKILNQSAQNHHVAMIFDLMTNFMLTVDLHVANLRNDIIQLKSKMEVIY